MRERIGELRERRLHLGMNAGDIIEYGLFLLDFHHERNGADEHSVSLFHTWVAASVIDCGISHFIFTHQTGKHIAERRLKHLIRRKSMILAPVVNQGTVDISRLLSHFADGILGMARQRCQLHAGIFLIHHSLRLLVFLIAETCCLVFCGIQHAIFLHRQRLAFVCQRHIALRKKRQKACAISQHVMDIHQQIAVFRRGNQLNAKKRLLTHEVERTAETMIGILLEVGFAHLATHNRKLLVFIHILTRLAFLIDKETDFQFRPCLKNRPKSSLNTVEVDIVCQLRDARNVILHYFRIFQAVVEHA